MVRINLLKQTSHKKRGGRFPTLPVVGGIVAATVVVAVVAILTGGAKRPPTGVEVVVAAAPKPKNIPAAPSVPAPVVEKKAVPETTAVQAPPKKAVTAAAPVSTATKTASSVKTAAKPVAATAPQTVKPAVIKGSSEQGALAKKETSSTPESINYDIAFAGRLFEKLTSAVPEGIGFGSLSVDSFATVSGMGLGPTRDIVGTLFTNLRGKPFRLRELPESYIESADKGYRFQFVCDASFAGEPVDPAVKAVSLKKLPALLKTFTKLSARDGMYTRQGLVRRSTKKSGAYVQVVYQFSCSGTYRNFVKYVLDLDKAHVPCAFSTVRIKARSEAIVDISADVVFTTR
jgi:hypothetical protein